MIPERTELSRIGDVDSSLTREGSSYSGFSRSDKSLCEIVREGVSETALTRIGDVHCSLSQVKELPISLYLEISPDVIWLVPWALNDVLSNTSWNIQ